MLYARPARKIITMYTQPGAHPLDYLVHARNFMIRPLKAILNLCKMPTSSINVRSIMANIPPPAIPATFLNLLTDVLRFGDRQANTLITEGYDSIQELRFWDYDDITTWTANKGKLAVNRGGCVYGDPRVKSLQALAFYATDMHRRGLPLNMAAFTDATLLRYKEMVRVDRAKKNLKSDVSPPEPLVENTIWEDWENSLINYLQTKTGIDKIPLSYVIRSNDRPVAVPDESEELTRKQKSKE